MGLAIVVAGSRTSTSAVAPDDWPVHIYLGNNPHGTDLPDWSENAQGLANDGHYWFFTNKTALFKYDANWEAVDGDDVGKLGSVSFPPELAVMGINHFGDPDHYGGYIFVPFESESPTTIIAAFRASDLSFVDRVDVSPFQTRAGWLAIDPVERILYTSTDRIIAGTPILRYALDVEKVDNSVEGDFLVPVAPMAILEGDGSQIAGQFIYIQGGVFTPVGDLYLSAGKAGDSPEDTRGGLHGFRRSADGSAFLLVESSVNADNNNGFAYEYHPGSTGLGEEPEGIDWWNRDNAPGSPYAGQLHAILLDNQAGDDQIWLKHYRVDYPPEIHCDSPDGAWHAGDVSIPCIASDEVSGLANPADASFSLSTHVYAGTEISDALTDSRQVCDVADNCATAGPIGGNMVDKKAPDIAIARPGNGDVYLLNAAVPAAYDCSDAGSGVASCSGSVPSGTNVPTSTIGATGFSVNASDGVGNAASAGLSYTVTFGTCLLYDPTIAKKSGSTYPIKLQLCDADGRNVSSPSIVVHATGVSMTTTNALGPLDDSGNANPDFDFRYDASLGGYIFNLKTTGLTTGTYDLNFTAGSDSIGHSAPFAVK
jgi:hypothetical protein